MYNSYYNEEGTSEGTLSVQNLTMPMARGSLTEYSQNSGHCIGFLGNVKQPIKNYGRASGQVITESEEIPTNMFSDITMVVVESKCSRPFPSLMVSEKNQ